ncbi:MAG TPA: hypothetical protein H9679_07640 [Firmicutes bacterium]|nr:hypothetical protein [Bacillota bacterium]
MAILLAASFVFMPKNNMSEFGMEEAQANGILGEKENTIDVLVLGDSESYSAITPMQIWKDAGYTAYVCGTSAQSLNYTSVLLRRAFEKQQPKVVILETNAIYRKISSNQAVGTELANYFSVFQYHNRWKSLGLHDFTGKAKFTWTDDYKGYRYRTKVDPARQKEYMKPTDKVAEIPALNIQYVREMKQFCDENGSRLVLVSTPSTVNWNFQRHNGIQKLANDIGCEYIDLNLMNDRIQIDWSKDTRDKGDHLNHFGAVKVSRFLSEYLKETGLLTDHREDPAYAKWNDSLKKYETIVEKA